MNMKKEKKNNRAFTVVELITSFALVMIIATVLLGIVISLKNMFENSGIKTQLLNKQAMISQKINQTFDAKTIHVVTKCGVYCLQFQYTDGTNDQLVLNYGDRTIQFGNYKTDLYEDSYFKDVMIDISYTSTYMPDVNDALLIIKIPIYNDHLQDQNFGVNIIYPFNTRTSNIYAVAFDDASNEFGYIALKGNTQKVISNTEAYAEDGYIVYDNQGKEIPDANVRITSPFEALTTPYITGDYEITYDLLDNKSRVVYSTKRKVRVSATV